MSVSLRVAKKRRVEAPAAAFADPDDDVEPTLSTEEEDEQVQKLKVPGLYICEGHRCKSCCHYSDLCLVLQRLLTIQDEGFEKAEGKEYSSAIRLWDMALKLRPQYAALHEMKAQVWLICVPAMLWSSGCPAMVPYCCSEHWAHAGISGSEAVLASCSICYISHCASLPSLSLSYPL